MQLDGKLRPTNTVRCHGEYRLNPKEKLIELKNILCPVRFEFLNKSFIVEIQYFYGSQNELGKEEDGYLVFATTSDAGDLLIKADFSSDEVLQREGDDIDSIDVTLNDLLSAKYVYS